MVAKEPLLGLLLPLQAGLDVRDHHLMKSKVQSSRGRDQIFLRVGEQANATRQASQLDARQGKKRPQVRQLVELPDLNLSLIHI